MIFGILSLVILALGFPALLFGSELSPSGSFASPTSRILWMLFIAILAPALGGILAGCPWRWKGALLAPLYVLSAFVSNKIIVAQAKLSRRPMITAEAPFLLTDRTFPPFWKEDDPKDDSSHCNPRSVTCCI